MPKPWARIEVGYFSHIKFLKLNANAISLWHEGKDYCDTHHTDGLIPREALQHFRFRGTKSVTMLSTSCGEKPSGAAYAPLWEEHPVGYKMHDYLDHNDCRDEVLTRLEDAEDIAELRKLANRGRQVKYRVERKARIAALAVTPVTRDEVRDKVRDKVRDRTRDVTRTCSPPTEALSETSPQPPSGGLSESGPLTAERGAPRREAPPSDVHVSNDLSARAGVFLERFQAIYAKVRDGAYYLLKPARDHEYACRLVAAWHDLDHLEKMVELFLLKKDWAPKNIPGTPGQFLHMAPACDALLRQHGHRVS